MALEQESFSSQLWMSVKKDAAFIAYSHFALTFLGRIKANTKDWSFNDQILIGCFVMDEKALSKAMHQSYSFAETSIEDADMKSRIKHLADSFELIRPTDCLKELKNIYIQKSRPLDPATRLSIEFISERNYLTDNAQQNAACAIIPLAVHLRVFVFLAQEIFPPGLRSRLLQSFFTEYSKILAPTEELLNELCAAVDVELVKKHYESALLHEIRFFVSRNEIHDLVPLVNPEFRGLCGDVKLVKRNLIVVTALGSTCVSTDVLDGVSEVAVLVAERAEQDAQIKRALDSIVAQNSVELNNCVERMLSMRKRNGFDFPALAEAMEILSESESMIRLKVESEVLGGIRVESLNLVAESMQYAYGWERFFRIGLATELLSFYMTSHAGFEDVLKAKYSAWDLNLMLGVLPTHAVCNSYFTAKEKHEIFKGIPKSGHMSLTICIGQSLNDLLCLLEADIGIVLGSDANLRKVAEKFGARFIRLVDWVVSQERDNYMDAWGSKSGRLFTVESWSELHAFVLGYIGVVDHFVIKLPDR